MTKRSLAALCCLLWGLAIPAMAEDAASLLVRVTDGNGKPVAGATVRALPTPDPRTWEPGPQVREETSADGRARISGLPVERTSWLLVERKGYAPELRSLLADASRTARIVLQPGGLLVGRVVDEKGRPVSGAEVELTGVPFFAWEPDLQSFLEHQATRRARTGRAGRFRFHDLPEGRFDLIIRHPEYAALAADRPVEGRTTGPLGTFVLRRGETLRGTVTGAAGQPVAGARIWVDAGNGFDAAEPPAHDAATGVDGTFSLPHRPAGQKTRLWVCADGFLQERAEVHFPEDPVEVRLQPAGSVRGRLLGPDGSPVAGAEIGLARADGISECSFSETATPCPEQDTATTDAEGRFHLARLSPFWYRVRASAPGWVDALGSPLRVAGGEPVEVGLRFEKGSAVTGRVLDPDGNPVPGARIWIGSERSSAQTVAQADGSFQIQGVAAGANAVIVHAAGYESIQQELEVPAGGRRADLVLEPASEPRPIEVRGQVLGPDGAPVEGARVFVSNGGVHSAWDGSFTLRMDRCNSSPQVIQVEKRGFAPGAVRVCLNEDRVDGFEIRLETGTWLKGRVTGLSAEEMRRVWIELEEGEMGPASADAEGHFALGPVAEGTWQVVASVGDRTERTTVSTESGQAEALLELELLAVREVSGQVLDSEARPVAGAVVAFQRPGQVAQETRARADGSFSALVPEGSFTLEVREGARRHEQFLTSTGPVTGLEIRLERGVTLRGRVLGVEPWEMVTIQLQGPSSSWGVVDLDGRWSAPGLPPGRWTLFATRDATLQEIRRTIEVPADLAAPDLEIDLDFTAVPLPLEEETETGGGQP